jgi:hypothetical protein
MAKGNTLSQVGGPAIAPPGANRGESMVPFRRATTFRTAKVVTSTFTNVATPTNSFDVVIEGSGFIYSIDLQCIVTTSANAAAVAYFEDAPWSTFTAVVFRDVNGELVNVPGFSLRVANIYGGWQQFSPWDNFTIPPVTASALSKDIQVAQLVSGAGGTGGSYNFHLYVPVALNRRSLWGLLGNQDRAQKYSLRTDLGSAAALATGPIYTTAPTTQGTGTLFRMYENYAVPAPQDANGHKQQQIPDKFGIVNFVTQSVNPTVPVGGATINHFLPRLGNTIRFMALILRSNGARATAESAANVPTQIQMNLGDTPIFVETPAYRRQLMFERYGFDAPQGVYAYDAITDFAGQAGYELGDDYFWTSGLVNAQFAISYPAGFGSTNNSLTVVTGDMLVPQNIDIYN